jgi:hypothetical protein
VASWKRMGQLDVAVLFLKYRLYLATLSLSFRGIDRRLTSVHGHVIHSIIIV